MDFIEQLNRSDAVSNIKEALLESDKKYEAFLLERDVEKKDPPRKIVSRREHAKKVRELSEISNLKATGAICFQWLVIVGSIWLALQIDHWLFFILTGFIIAGRQHGLYILMHDMCHFRFYSNRFANDFIAPIFTAAPIFNWMHLFRHRHLLHHRDYGTDYDPEQPHQVRETRWVFFKNVLRDFSGLNAPAMFVILRSNFLAAISDDNQGAHLQRILYSLFYIVAGLFIASLDAWPIILALWLVPMFTILSFLFRIRYLAEHVCMERNHELDASRLTIPNILESFFMVPWNISYHNVHHLFPSIPFYNLRKAHRELMKDPIYKDNVHICWGYFGKRGVLPEVIEPRMTSSEIA